MMSVPRGGVPPSTLRLVLAAVAVAAGAGTAACGSGDSPPSPSATAPSFVSSLSEDPTTAERRAVERAYVQFWTVSRGLDQLPQEQWRSTLEKVSVDSMLTQLLEGTRIQRDQGIKLYGQVVAHVTGVEVKPDRAEVQDCQDASQAGQADARTGKPRTVGVPRNPVKGTLVRGADGAWRVALIEYPGGNC